MSLHTHVATTFRYSVDPSSSITSVSPNLFRYGLCHAFPCSILDMQKNDPLTAAVPHVRPSKPCPYPSRLNRKHAGRSTECWRLPVGRSRAASASPHRRRVAVCEFPTTTGPVDYLLFAQGRPLASLRPRGGNHAERREPQAWRCRQPARTACGAAGTNRCPSLQEHRRRDLRLRRRALRRAAAESTPSFGLETLAWAADDAAGRCAAVCRADR